jgi:hypothetical protein
MALRNPLLDFDAVLFAKAAPTRFPHISDQYYGWWSRPGGGIFVLEGFRGDKPRLRCLTSRWAVGSYHRPDLSYDGRKVIFAYCRYHEHVPEIKNKADKSNVPEDAFYHIFEMNIDGTGVRQLTHGRYDDFDARYLPSGEIVFLSTRKGVALQCGKASAAATEKADLPDSYVRCGGDEYRPVPVFTLHKMDADGANLRAISAFENFEWNPAVAEDGRILYARWDYERTTGLRQLYNEASGGAGGASCSRFAQDNLHGRGPSFNYGWLTCPAGPDARDGRRRPDRAADA